MGMKADSLTMHKDNEGSDEFFVKDDEGDSSAIITTSSINTYVYHTPCGEEAPRWATWNPEDCPNEPIDNGWKLQAVRGFVQNDQDDMSGWWKSISTNNANGFTTAHLDFI